MIIWSVYVEHADEGVLLVVRWELVDMGEDIARNALPSASVVVAW